MGKLRPIIGYRTYFSANRMDSGWFSTSLVEGYEVLENGDVLMTTHNSIYLAEEVEND